MTTAEIGWYEDREDKILFVPGTPTVYPPTGLRFLFVSAAGVLSLMDSAGTVTAASGEDASAITYTTDSGLTATTVAGAIDELAGLVAAVGQPSTATARGTYLVSGGRLIYSGSGYVYAITGGTGYIDGEPVSWTGQDITLTAADATNDRIDIFVVNSSGTVSAIAGTPAATPSKPDVDPALYLELTFALVYANTATPTNTTVVDVYTEAAGTPGEWDATASAGTVTVDSTTDPRTGTKCIRAVSATNNTTITLTAAAPITAADYDLFTLYIKLLSAWNNKGLLSLQWYWSTVKVGNAVSIKPGENGLLASNTTTYQGQAFLIPQFGFAVGAVVDKLVITVTGATLSFALDDLTLQAFGGGVTVVTDSGITQAEADARYIQSGTVDAKGDLIVARSADTIARLAVGSNGYALTANSGATNGVEWRAQTQIVNVLIGDGSSVITTGVKAAFEIPAAMTITAWRLVSVDNTSGAIKIDLWADSYANFPPTNDDSITNGHEPEIAASGVAAEDTDIADWSGEALAAGTWVLVNVDSVASMKLIDLALTAVRT